MSLVLGLKLRALRVGAALLSLRLASEMPGITRDRFETVWHLRTLALRRRLLKEEVEELVAQLVA